MKKHSTFKIVLVAAAAVLALNSCSDPVRQTEGPSAVAGSAETAAEVQTAETEQSDVPGVPEADSGAADVPVCKAPFVKDHITAAAAGTDRYRIAQDERLIVTAYNAADSGKRKDRLKEYLINMGSGHTAGTSAGDDAPAKEAPPAGAYIRIAKAGRDVTRSTPEEQLVSTMREAFEYYKENNLFKGYVINEDGTGTRCYTESYDSVIFEDGCMYDSYGGLRYELRGDALLVGIEDASDSWAIYYRLTDKQTAELSALSDIPEGDGGIIKIYTPTYTQSQTLMDALYMIREAGEDPQDYFNELTAMVNEVAEQEAAELEQRREQQEKFDRNTLASSCIVRQLDLNDIFALNGGNVPVCTDETGKISFIGGTCTDKPVENEQDALKVVQSVKNLIGCKGLIFECYDKFTCPGDITYYTFADYDEYGSFCGSFIVKIMVGGDNKMLALSSAYWEDAGYSKSRFEAEGEKEYTGCIDPSDLPEIVYENSGYDRSRITVCDEFTQTAFIDFATMNIKGLINSYVYTKQMKVWTVYTNNPGDDKYPYLVHYITLYGAYVCSLPVAAPSDTAALSGSSAVYTFDGMTPAQWTGQVYYDDGHSETVTVPVMKDEKTGKYYLADTERKIAAADYYEFIYNGCKVDMLSSDTNDDWDNHYLITYSNTIKTWDYYDKLGLTGSDGKGIPTLILCDCCDNDHNPIDNASFSGNFAGWTLFEYSNVSNLGTALDTVTHEYTHAFTKKSCVRHFYQNDGGAINEAFSDILGELIEFEITGREEDEWEISGGDGVIMRSAANPHKYSQPEYVWDIYYMPHAVTFTQYNDYGGVHINSSLLYNMAYKLVTYGEMTHEEAIRFWMNLDMIQTTATDFKQLAAIIPWLTEALGMSRYTSLAQQYVEDARLSENTIPEELEENAALVTLTLPDNNLFKDGYWIINAYDEVTNLKYRTYYRDDYARETEHTRTSPIIRYLSGETEDRTLSIMAEPGYYLIEISHYNVKTGLFDIHMGYDNGVWINSEENGLDLYHITEGYNVLSTEGLEELIIDN